MSAIAEYLGDVRRYYATGDAREHTYRPALRDLLEAIQPGLIAINEPKHTLFGAVDLVVRKGQSEIGWVETKDLGHDLVREEKSEQLQRYRGAFPNLILTDYLTFRWYVNGKLRDHVSVATVSDGKLCPTADAEGVLERLLGAFLSQQVYRPGRPEDLARRMARLARIAEDGIVRVLREKGDRGQLQSQLQAFRGTLLGDITEDQFADMCAQTIAYGLFAARCYHPTERHFDRFLAAHLLPETNPLLRDLLYELIGPRLDERIVWVVEELASLLLRTDMREINKAFTEHRQRRMDPVVHFYETFLSEYSPSDRKRRGVYYTPEPVVSYMVRSVDLLLRTEFDKPDGLADPSVFVLDPACGTGTFLFFVIEHIHQTVTERYGPGAWAGYVRDNLLGRLFGFELLMAPYSIAHLKLGMLLRETGYEFTGEQRLQIYLTNTLEEAKAQSELPLAQSIAEEGNRASGIKRDSPIMVVIGNPPYAGHSANASERQEEDGLGRKRKVKTWIGDLIEDYKTVDGRPLGERNSKWLQDDYVKFIRFGQWRIEQTGHGILALITNHGYLDNPTFRGMRQQITQAFPLTSILDLHGNNKKKEVAPDGGKDKNVFDIQQGVAIGLFRRPATPTEACVEHAELWGSRESKNDVLSEGDVGSTVWTRLDVRPPGYLLKPSRDDEVAREYWAAWAVPDIWLQNASTITTGRNEFLLAFTGAEMRERIAEFVDTATETDELKRRYFMGVIDLDRAREAVRKDEDWQAKLRSYAYRPFDTRHTFYSTDLITRSRFKIMRHMLEPNLALLTHRPQSPQDFTYAFCCNTIADQCIAASKSSGGGNSYLFPLYLYPKEGSMEAGHARRPNLNPAFIDDVSARLGLSFIEDGQGDLTETFGPEDVLHYVYAILHSPTYRERYAEFLKVDFPRIPLTADPAQFRRLCTLGHGLVGLHLLGSPLLSQSPARLEGEGDNLVEAVRYDDANRRVYINSKKYFSGINKAVYEFQVGGYQVMDKWLKDRKGRTLNFDDIRHYTQVAQALTETMRLMREIDEAIPGWPIQ